jgi:hypothetical protein
MRVFSEEVIIYLNGFDISIGVTGVSIQEVNRDIVGS